MLTQEELREILSDIIFDAITPVLQSIYAQFPPECMLAVRR